MKKIQENKEKQRFIILACAIKCKKERKNNEIPITKEKKIY